MIPPHFAATVTDEDGKRRTYAIPADAEPVEDPQATGGLLDPARLLAIAAEDEGEPDVLVGDVRFRMTPTYARITVDMSKFDDALGDLEQTAYRGASRRAKPVNGGDS